MAVSPYEATYNASKVTYTAATSAVPDFKVTTQGETDLTKNPNAGPAAQTETPEHTATPGINKAAYGASAVPSSGDSTVGKYASYLEREYSDPNKLPTDSQRRTQYDLERERIAEEYGAGQSDIDKYVRALSARGGIQDSGISAKLSASMMSDLSKRTGAGLRNVGVQELGAIQARQERLGSQAFAGEQASKGRELQVADLSLREKGLMENIRQFDNEMAFREWATKEGFTENEINRSWQANQNAIDRQQRGEFFYADLNMQEKRMAQEAWQFTNRIEFDKWATEKGIEQVVADRIWKATENEKEREYGVNMLNFQTGATAYLNGLASELRKGEMTFADALETAKTDRGALVTMYGMMGRAGTLPAGYTDAAQFLADPNVPAYLKTAYKSGQAGKTLDDIIKADAREEQFFEASMLSLDPDNPTYQAAIRNIAQTLGIEVPDISKSGYDTSKSGDVIDFPPEAQRKVDIIKPKGVGNDRYVHAALEQAYNAGKKVSIAGKQYTVQSVDEINIPFGIDDTQYVLIGDDGTTKTITANNSKA